MDNYLFSEKRLICMALGESLPAPKAPEAPTKAENAPDAQAQEKQAHELVDKIARLRTAILESHPNVANPSSTASEKMKATYKKLTTLQKQMEDAIKGNLDKAKTGLSKIISETLKSLDDVAGRLSRKHPISIARNKYMTGLMKQVKSRQSLRGPALVGLMSSLRPGESMVTIFQKGGKVTGGGKKNIKRAIDYGGLIVVVKRVKAKRGDEKGDRLRITYIDRGYDKDGAYEKREELVATFGIGKNGWEVRDKNGTPFSATTKGPLAYMDLLFRDDDKMDLVVRDSDVPLHTGPKLEADTPKPKAATPKELAEGGSVPIPTAAPGKDIKVFRKEAPKEDTTVSGTPPVSPEIDRLLEKAAKMEGYFASKPGERVLPTLPGTDKPAVGGAQPMVEEVTTVLKKSDTVVALKKGAEQYVKEVTMDADGNPTALELGNNVAKVKIHDIVDKPLPGGSGKISVATGGKTRYAEYKRGTYREIGKGGSRIRVWKGSIIKNA